MNRLTAKLMNHLTAKLVDCLNAKLMVVNLVKLQLTKINIISLQKMCNNKEVIIKTTAKTAKIVSLHNQLAIGTAAYT